jgi:hypothetical protein
MWGSISNSIDFNYERVNTIYNGKCLPAGVSMLFVNGEVDLEFIVSSIPERNLSNHRAVITDSEGAILRKVNDIPILDYLKSVGLIINKENITTTPLMVYYKDATEPVALGFYTLFEDGSVLTGGEMPIGTSFTVGSIDAQGIFESANTGLKKILAIKDRKATFLLPCVTRYIMLAPEQENELKLILDTLKNEGPFMMGYSGGEISPIKGKNSTYNRFHNYTFCACIIK